MRIPHLLHALSEKDLSSITSMIREIADSQAIIRSIKLDDLELLMAKEHSILSVLVVEKSSQYLTLSLSAFVKQFYTTFKEEIDKDAIVEKSHYYGKARLLARNISDLFSNLFPLFFFSNLTIRFSI